MSTTLPNMGLVQPTEDGDDGVWDTTLNADLAVLDAHDHSTGKGVRIGAGGLNIASDVTFNGTGALIAAKAISFTAQAAYTVARSLFVSSADDELYWRSAAGVNVKITSGAALNVSIVGGLTGDYATSGAEFYYDQAAETYRALVDTPLPNDWAAIACGNLDLYEHASGIANRVRLQSPAALAASYAVTWPGAVPGATALLQWTSTGVVQSNVTGSRPPAFFTTLDANSTVTFTSTVNLGTAVAAFTSTGVVTATDFKHTTARILKIGAADFAIPNTSTARLNAVGSEIELLTHAGAETAPSCVAAIKLDVGMRITQILIMVTGGTNPVGRLRRVNDSGGETSIANATSAGGIISLTGLSVDIAVNQWHYVQVEGTTTTGDTVVGVEVTYTRP